MDINRIRKERTAKTVVNAHLQKYLPVQSLRPSKIMFSKRWFIKFILFVH